MPEYPRFTAKEAEKLLLRSGFVLDRQKGSHRIYKKKTYRMVLSSHAGEILHSKIIKQLFDVIHGAEDKT